MEIFIFGLWINWRETVLKQELWGEQENKFRKLELFGPYQLAEWMPLHSLDEMWCHVRAVSFQLTDSNHDPNVLLLFCNCNSQGAASHRTTVASHTWVRLTGPHHRAPRATTTRTAACGPMTQTCSATAASPARLAFLTTSRATGRKWRLLTSSSWSYSSSSTLWAAVPSGTTERITPSGRGVPTRED